MWVLTMPSWGKVWFIMGTFHTDLKCKSDVSYILAIITIDMFKPYFKESEKETDKSSLKFCKHWNADKSVCCCRELASEVTTCKQTLPAYTCDLSTLARGIVQLHTISLWFWADCIGTKSWLIQSHPTSVLKEKRFAIFRQTGACHCFIYT